MNFTDYQEHATSTADFDDDDQALDCVLAGLTGELGEMMEAWKKYRRGDDVKAGMSEIGAFRKFKAKTILEAGDVLWYLSMYLYLWDIDLERVALMNLNKLSERQANGVLHGSGDTDEAG